LDLSSVKKDPSRSIAGLILLSAVKKINQRRTYQSFFPYICLDFMISTFQPDERDVYELFALLSAGTHTPSSGYDVFFSSPVI